MPIQCQKCGKNWFLADIACNEEKIIGDYNYFGNTCKKCFDESIKKKAMAFQMNTMPYIGVTQRVKNGEPLEEIMEFF